MAGPKRETAEQSLFVKHFSAGQQSYDAGHFEDAEKQLEEAYLLRPRDHKVLNLLGLLYFKQEKYAKAEEVYRKLAADSPTAHTLFYNLGLIYLKLNRLDDAELALLKSLEISKDNPKINFYLGSIYERQRRFQDAIFQYRQAGANVMVRRVEDKLQPGARPAGTAKDDDTAEFKGVLPPPKRRGTGETQPLLMPPKPIQPVSDVLLADASAKAAAAPRSDARAKTPVGGETIPPGSATIPPSSATLPPGTTIPPSAATLPPGRSHDIVAFLAGLPANPPKERTGITGVRSGNTGVVTPARTPEVATSHTLPPRRVEPFRLLQRNLMEITFSGKVFVKQGTIYSYTGNLTFWVKDKRQAGAPALVIVTGDGKVLLTDRDREITISSVEGGLSVQPGALLACEESLVPRYIRLSDDPSAPEFLRLEGQGLIAIAVATRPLTLAVTPEQPVAVAASSVIMWAGAVTPTLVQDQGLSEALLAPGAPAAALIRLEGKGRVLMEQSL